MKKRAATEVGKQESSLGSRSSSARPSLSRGMTAQLLLPMLQGIAETRAGLLEFVYQQGLEALEQMLQGEAEAIVGPKGKHLPDRTHHHWGSTQTSMPMGGRRVVIERPRVRGKDGREAVLPSVEAFAAHDPLPDRVTAARSVVESRCAAPAPPTSALARAHASTPPDSGNAVWPSLRRRK